MRPTRRACGVLSLALCLMGSAACSDSDANAEYGAISVAIQTTGSDGATYRLPSSSVVNLSRADTFEYYGSFSVEGDEEVVTFQVVAGSYLAELHAGFGSGTSWPLERSLGGETEIVIATLVTEQPVPLLVQGGLVTDLVFSFVIPDIGTVTFDHGSIAVTVAVDRVETTSAAAGFEASVTTSFEHEVNETAPPELFERLASPDGTHRWQWEVAFSGPWYQMSSIDACAPVNVANFWGEGSNGLLDFHAELVDAAGELCVTTAGWIWLQATSSNPAFTGTFSTLPYDFVFDLRVLGVLPEAVFDGQTIDLPALSGVWPLEMAAVEVLVSGGEVGAETMPWFQGGYRPADDPDQYVVFNFLPVMP
jgi:hypothetical protein